MRRICIGSLIVVVVVSIQFAAVQPAAWATTEEAPVIEGRSAIVLDADTGAILYEHQSRQRLAPASLTKIFTAYFAIEATPPQRRMAVVKDDLVGEASAGLNAGDNLSFETLLHGLMLASGNDAAMTIARNVGTTHSPSALDGVASFTSHMNARIESLGLKDTHLTNPHGLDAARHYSSAHDIAAMTMLALQTEPEFLKAISAPGYAGEGYQFDQRNQIIGNYPGGLGGKTGITDDAGFCLMTVAHRDGRTIISVVLGSTQESWYRDSMALLDAGFGAPSAADTSVVTLSSTEQASFLSTMPASIQGLAVYTVSDSISVQTALTASAGSWHVMRWPISTLLAMIVAFVVAIQMRALAELQKRPRAAGMRPRTARVPHQPQVQHRPVMDETQPFSTIRNWERSATSWTGSAGD
jgi:serine-type D-Ala-D-Ala carboxypeptidase (penicillin-binding protein 5/6)